MSKVNFTTLCIIAILLLSMLTYAAARPSRAFHDVTPVETHHTDEEIAKAKVDEEENCTGAGEEDCLMRRTLAAHLDYIYTQKKQP